LSDKLTWGLRANTYLEDYLKESDNVKHQLLLKFAASHDELTGDIIERVRQGHHVYIDWKMNLLYIMKSQFLQTDHCDFALGRVIPNH
jgi:glutamate receptor, ionotropic, invertebrate